jgi:hypothetical protein
VSKKRHNAETTDLGSFLLTAVIVIDILVCLVE